MNRRWNLSNTNCEYRTALSRQPKMAPFRSTLSFTVDFANAIAEHESYNKHLYRPNTYLHKWWARRCGSTFRLILKHLVQDEAQRDYYVPGGLAGKIILDPMMGGGTTLHEAIRLEANVIGADIDPIPVLQARPATLSELPLPQLEAAFEQFYQTLHTELTPYFMTACPSCRETTEVQFTLHGLYRTCKCGPANLRQFGHPALRNRWNGDPPLSKLSRRHAAAWRMTARTCHCSLSSDKPPLIEKGTEACATCGASYLEDYRRPFYSRYTPLAIVGQCPQHGLFFTSPTAAHLTLIEQADVERAGLDFGLPADFAVLSGPKSADLISHGITSYLDLFSSRQSLCLRRAIATLGNFPPLIRLNLALLVSTSLEFNSMLCGYKGGDNDDPAPSGKRPQYITRIPFHTLHWRTIRSILPGSRGRCKTCSMIAFARHASGHSCHRNAF